MPAAHPMKHALPKWNSSRPNPPHPNFSSDPQSRPSIPITSRCYEAIGVRIKDFRLQSAYCINILCVAPKNDAKTLAPIVITIRGQIPMNRIPKVTAYISAMHAFNPCKAIKVRLPAGQRSTKKGSPETSPERAHAWEPITDKSKTP